MTGERYPPDDPREWLNRAYSNLRLARTVTEGVYLEELCYMAQQAAEKAIKAIFIALGQPHPYTHDLDRLLGLLKDSGIPVPAEVWRARSLSVFAFEPRYPGIAKEATEEQHREALAVGEAVVRWAERIILAEGCRPA